MLEALAYVKRLERENSELEEENRELKAENSRLLDTINNLTTLLNAAHDETAKMKAERDALHAIVAKDGLCETCKHHKTCVYEEGPIEMDCVCCEREDCKCVGCTSKNDHWEWVGVTEEST